MKKIIFTIAMAFSFLTAVQAQVEIKGLAGLNFASLSNAPSDLEYAARMGYQFGAGVLIGDKFYVEPGIQFVRNSRTITPESTEEFRFDQNFVKIPVYAGYHLIGHESGPIALRIFAGPAMALAGKVKEGADQISKEDIKNAHWMVDAGIGVDVFFLFAEVNYEYAFSKYFEDDSFDAAHSGFLFNVGIHIDF